MNWLKALLPKKRGGAPVPRRIPREAHPVSRSQISQGTLRTLYGLKDAGYEAYLVGGGVRDLIAGITPKDFDVATNATPEQVKGVFRSCRLIGRRFVICHVRFGNEITEVATFRGAITDGHERDETGRILSDNEYGTLETDAWRRDFTINALYYDIRDYSVVDLVGGLADMERREIRMIGDPELRYREDPVRMLRAIRIANKLGFSIHKQTAEPIPRLAALLREIPPARLFDEVIKLLQTREALANFEGLRTHGLLRHLLPQTDKSLDQPGMQQFVSQALTNTADRLSNEQSVSPAFLYAALFWPAVAREYRRLMGAEGQAPSVAIAQAGDAVIAKAQQFIAIPKRFSLPMREIWVMQPRLEAQSRGSRGQRLLAHPRFRAAYDFLLLRAGSGEVPTALADYWTQAQGGVDLATLVPDEGPESEAGSEPAPRKRRRRRRRGGGAAPAPASG